jgi:hypothetical protein
MVDTDLKHEFIVREARSREAYLARDIGTLTAMWSEELIVNSH